LLSDINDYPIGQDVYQCIQGVKAKPFCVYFDDQVEAAEALYGQQLKLSFTRKDVREALELVKELYPEDVIARVEETIYEQMRRYAVYF